MYRAAHPTTPDLPLDVLTELSLQFRTTWELYIAFYTAFIAMNIAGLVLAVETLQTVRAKTIRMRVFICQNLLAGITAVGLGVYSNATANRAGRLLELQLLEDAQARGVVSDTRAVTDIPIPEQLAISGAASNALGHVFFIAGWVVVGRLDRTTRHRCVIVGLTAGAPAAA